MRLLYERAVPALLLWLTTCALIGTLAYGAPYAARAAGGTLLVLVLPGIALIRAFAGRRSVDPLPLVVFAVGLSLALTVMCGLALNLIPSGVTARGMGTALGVLTLLGCVVGLVRERPAPPRIHLLRGPMTQLLLLLPALAITVAAFEVARGGAADVQRGESFTQLYALPLRTPGGAVIGLQSHERRKTTYRLEVRRGGELVRTWPRITLAPGQSRRILLSLTLSSTGRLSARLFRSDRPRVVYRRIHITLP